MSLSEILKKLPPDKRDEYLRAKREQAERKFCMFNKFFPDQTTEHSDGSIFHSRDGYAKHLEFFEKGAQYRERAFMAANRSGKTIAGAYETTCHLTGDYPNWWTGKRFDHAISAWAAGKTFESTRDIIQLTLLGNVKHEGSRKRVDGMGMIPGHKIGELTWKTGVPNLIDTVKVKHVTGAWSLLGLKAYQQGRGAFEGTAKHLIWPDEEPPVDIYGEMITRTATVDGIIMLTFTPLEGMSETAQLFMADDDRPMPELDRG